MKYGNNDVILLKDLLVEMDVIAIFWQLLRAVHALFIIITLLMVFTKWQSQVHRDTMQ